MDFNSPLISEIFDPKADIAITIDMDTYNLVNSIFGYVPRKINIDLFTMVKGIAVYQNNHAYWLLEYTMRNLIQAGIPQFVRKSIFDMQYKNDVDSANIAHMDIKKQAVFTMEDLQFGFVIWLVSILIAVIAFALELIYFYGKMSLKSVVGLISILKFLKSLRV